MKHIAFIGLWLGLLLLGGEGARAASFYNYLDHPVRLDVTGVGSHPYTSEWIWDPGFVGSGGQPLAGWTHSVTVQPGESFPLVVGSVFGVADSQFATIGDFSTILDDAIFDGTSNSWVNQGSVSGSMYLGSPDGSIAKARLVGAPSGWDAWNTQQEASYGPWAPPSGSDGNLGAVASVLVLASSTLVSAVLDGFVAFLAFAVWLFILSFGYPYVLRMIKK